MLSFFSGPTKSNANSMDCEVETRWSSGNATALELRNIFPASPPFFESLQRGRRTDSAGAHDDFSFALGSLSESELDREQKPMLSR